MAGPDFEPERLALESDATELRGQHLWKGNWLGNIIPEVMTSSVLWRIFVNRKNLCMQRVQLVKNC